MGIPAEKPETEEALRQRAERIAGAVTAQSQEEIAASATGSVGLLLHELLVHKLELEMQNEELRRAQGKLEAQKARYFDLYDLAPVGYLSLDERGLILEANLTASRLTGMPRSRLVAQPFTRFVHKEDQDVYYRFRKTLLDTGEAQACELRMVKDDGTVFWGGLSAAVAQDEDGRLLCRLTIGDVSGRKKAEEDLRRSLEEKESLLRALHRGG